MILARIDDGGLCSPARAPALPAEEDAAAPPAAPPPVVAAPALSALIAALPDGRSGKAADRAAAETAAVPALAVDLVIVDEASMIDLEMMARHGFVQIKRFHSRRGAARQIIAVEIENARSGGIC